MIVQPGRAFPANTPVPYGGGGAACRVGASLPPAGALTLSGACSHARTPHHRRGLSPPCSPQPRRTMRCHAGMPIHSIQLSMNPEVLLPAHATPRTAHPAGHLAAHAAHSQPRARYMPSRFSARVLVAPSPPPGAMLMPSHAPPLATACQACMMEETCLHAAPAESSHHGSGGVGCLVRCERCAAGHPRPCECATHALRCHQRLATAPATVRSGSASLPLSRPCRSRTPLGRGASLRGLPP